MVSDGHRCNASVSSISRPNASVQRGRRSAAHQGGASNLQAYASPEDMWAAEAGNGWYEKGVEYWASAPATVDGVLGGYGRVAGTDALGSLAFAGRALKHLLGGGGTGGRVDGDRSRGRLAAADCGAGMGRVTRDVLSKLFDEVTLVEPVGKLLQQARVELAPLAGGEGAKEFRFEERGLETFRPAAASLDVVWIQWCIGHLTDADMVSFLGRCEKALRPGGRIVVKENNCREGFVVDKEDSSVTRSDSYFRELFKHSGLELFHCEVQGGLPKELFAVRMYALGRPSEGTPGAGVKRKHPGGPGLLD